MEPSGGIGRLCSGLRGSKKKQWRFGERETRSRDQGKDRMSVERGTEFFFFAGSKRTSGASLQSIATY